MNLFTKQKQAHRHRKQTYGYQRGGEERDTLGVWDKNTHTTTSKIDNQQGLTVQHREVQSVSYNTL